jgi:hypothetical protein
MGTAKKTAMTNEELILKTELAVKTERRSTSEVVRLFQEISNRKLYLERGFPNLYEMATKHFGYCAGSAMRRINAMRLAQTIPAVESKLESGELSLSVASEVQSFFYSEAKLNRPYSLNAKIELVETCLNKSRREVERELVRRNPERENRESIRQTSIDRVRVSFSISEELNQKLNRLKDLLSHTNPSTEDLLDRLAEIGLDKFDPDRKAARARSRRETQKTETGLSFDVSPQNAKTSPSSQASSQRSSRSPPRTTIQDSQQVSTQMTPPSEVASVSETKSTKVFSRSESTSELTTDTAADDGPPSRGLAPTRSTTTPSTPPTPPKRSRYISSRERHQMKDHEKGCTFKDHLTGRRCGHTKFLERDHIEPYSKGGANTATNLTWLCSAHNKLRYARES